MSLNIDTAAGIGSPGLNDPGSYITKVHWADEHK